MAVAKENIKEEFFEFINQKSFPCVGAKSALTRDNILLYNYGSMLAEGHHSDVLADIYRFIENFDIEKHMFSSFVALFPHTPELDEQEFENALWATLQSLHDLDSALYPWDKTVSNDVRNSNFSFSLGSAAFFIIGLNPNSKRKSRRFGYPAIVFNLHSQFDKLRETGKFDAFRRHIHRNDTRFCGSPNLMLANYGDGSEVLQYSGRLLSEDWKCPLKVRNER